MIYKNVAFGKSARKVRESKGLSQEEVAEQADIGSSHLSKIETGKRPKMLISTVLKICNALETKFDEIVKTKS